MTETSTTTPSSETVKSTDHEQNDNWEWSTAVTEFVLSHVSGRSLKICPGLKPICDVNVDIKRLDKIANSENADFTVSKIPDSDEQVTELRSLLSDSCKGEIYGKITPSGPTINNHYTGYACTGDMFALPFEDNSFDTTVADPPWLDLSQTERKEIFEEAVRVTRPTGTIIYNATWVPETNDSTREYKLRFRQQKDFWGGCSFISFHKRTATDMTELFEAYDYDSEQRYPEDSPYWSEAYHPNALSKEHNTNPKLISSEYDEFCCPMCGCSQLGQLRTDFHESSTGEYNTYECLNCSFRVDEQEVKRLAEALQQAAADKDVDFAEIETIEHTPRSITTEDDMISPSMPWSPSDTQTEKENCKELTSYNED